MELQDHGESVQLADARVIRRAGPGHPEMARHQPEAGVTSMDDSLLLEERMSPGGGLLLMSCILVAPLVIAGYVGLTVLLFLPLLGLRWIFPRLRVAGVATFWNAATRSA